MDMNAQEAFDFLQGEDRSLERQIDLVLQYAKVLEKRIQSLESLVQPTEATGSRKRDKVRANTKPKRKLATPKPNRDKEKA